MKHGLPRAMCSFAFVVLFLVWPVWSRAAPLVFWSEYTGNKVQKVTVGNGPVTVYSGPTNLYGLAVDGLHQTVYWVDLFNDAIRRIGYDGTGAATVLTITPPAGSQSTLAGVALDLSANKLYFTDATDFGHPSFIRRANLDGTNVETIVTTSASTTPINLALDLVHGKLYWTDYASQAVYRANLDGTLPEIIITGTTAAGVALDLGAGRMYLSTRTGTVNSYAYQIRTANLDGSGMANLYTSGLNDPRGLDIDPVTGIGYVADLGSNRILQFALNGSGVPVPIATGLSTPIDVALPTFPIPEPACVAPLAGAALLVRPRRRRRD